MQLQQELSLSNKVVLDLQAGETHTGQYNFYLRNSWSYLQT